MISPTNKEREVLSLVSIGLTTKEIAHRLQLSHHTVESHRKNLRKKFQAKNSAELVQKIFLAESQVRQKTENALFSA
ncbi:MAG TPA: helix-turn-helix transcriptional regulator [Chryseosolibacter sp.]